MQSADSAELSLDSHDLAEHALRDLAAGKDIMLLVSAACGQDVLDHAAGRLVSRRDRIVRVSGGGGGGLSLPGLLRQLGRYAARPSPGPIDAPERDIAVITTLGPSCDRIILMVDNGDALDNGALRAVELSCRTPGLRLVFAGLPSMATLLDDPDLPMLRARLLRGVRYTAIAATAGTVDPVVATPKALAPRHRRRMVAAACVVGLALLGLATVRALVSPATERPGLPEIAATVGIAPAPAPDAVAEVRHEPEPLPQPEPPPLAAVPSSDPADPAPTQTAPSLPLPATPQMHGLVRATQHRAPHRSSPGASHAPEAARAPGRLADKDPPGDYIGTFSAGADGVRSFRYRP